MVEETNMTLQLEKEKMTVGISNIVLKEKPSKLSCIVNLEDSEKIKQAYLLFHSLNDFEQHEFVNPVTKAHKIYFKSTFEVDSRKVLQCWRNFGTTLRLHVMSNWRYLFFEIDTKDTEILNEVIAVYEYMQLPLYYHETMKGYHFFSVKPITRQERSIAIDKLKKLNPKYPPITLRVKANKYPNESFLNGHILTTNGKKHSDTVYFRKWIEEENFIKLRENYYLVWYSLENGKTNREDKWSLTENDL